ncbi:hypothetical protein AKO1_002818 [Acrasis kona]|uniref:Peptidase C14 caspase domain-containing protein n=1 Tax=Acrasis kona TaxID=1008807 RepID=A0AAW2YU35_9EUKA
MSSNTRDEVLDIMKNDVQSPESLKEVLEQLDDGFKLKDVQSLESLRLLNLFWDNVYDSDDEIVHAFEDDAKCISKVFADNFKCTKTDDVNLSTFDFDNTREEMTWIIDDLTFRLPRKELLVIYYSGHGKIHAEDSEFDSELNLVKHGKGKVYEQFSISDFIRKLDEKLDYLEYKGVVLFVLDCCHSAAAARAVPEYQKHFFCSSNKYAVADSLKGKGVFTSAFVKALEELSTRSEVTYSDLVERAQSYYIQNKYGLKVYPLSFSCSKPGSFSMITKSPSTSDLPIPVLDKLHLMIDIHVTSSETLYEIRNFVKKANKNGDDIRYIHAYRSNSTHINMVASLEVCIALMLASPFLIQKVQLYKGAILSSNEKDISKVVNLDGQEDTVVFLKSDETKETPSSTK